jgi:hypothetical protein
MLARMPDGAYGLGSLGGLRLSVMPSALVGSLALWAILSASGVGMLGLPVGAALLGGLAAMSLHWFSDIVHHSGHAWAACRTGYPMTGIRLWGVLGSSVYPADEPQLPAAVHIRRALGGPIASLLLTVVAGLIALALRPSSGILGWVALFFFLENLFVFTLQVFIPLSFNDGGTLLYWLRHR